MSKEKPLALCYVGAVQQGAPPMALVGRVESEDDLKIVLKCPMSSDVAYFSLMGKRLKPLLDAREIQEAKRDQSMRALPQVSPSDLIMMGSNSCADYLESEMVLYKGANMVYSTILKEGSSYTTAYEIMVAKIKEKSAISDFFNESIFDFEYAEYLEKLMDPAESEKVIIAPTVNTEPQR